MRKLWKLEGQANQKLRINISRLDADLALVLADDDIVRNRQAQTGTILAFCGEKRVKDFLDDLGRDATPIVAD